MKVVKLNKRHRLYKSGFNFAFRFSDGEYLKFYSVESFFSKNYGSSWRERSKWESYVSKGGRGTIRWVGVRDESLIAHALLTKADELNK